MTIQSRQYQTDLKLGVYDSWARGNKNVLAVLPTGGGKSVIISEIALEKHQLGATQAIMAHRTELVGQMSLHIANRGIKHRIIAPKQTIAQISAEHRRNFNGYSFINPDANCSVGAVDTILARKDMLGQWAAQVDDWTIDECFPAGALISTTQGQIPIEDIKVGDSVLAFDEKIGNFEYKNVMRLFKNPTPHTMIDISINGSNIQATPGHPFWTNRGWVEAKDLTNADHLYVRLHRVWRDISDAETTSGLSTSQNRSGILYDKLWNEIQRCSTETETEENGRTGGQTMSSLLCGSHSQTCENLLEEMSSSNFITYNECHQQKICIRPDEKKQSDETGRITRKNETNLETNWSQTIGAGRQWEIDTGTREDTNQNVGTDGFCTSICNKNKHEKRTGFADLLQTRHGSPDFENFNRSGRFITQCDITAKVRPIERYIFEMQRVGDIKVLKRSDIEKAEPSFVYNIEVDEHHSYVTNDTVVHNCHHVLKTNKWGKVIDLFPNANGLGVTATPKRADGMGLGRYHDGVFDDMICGPTMRNLIDMGYLCDYEIAIPESDFHIDDDKLAPSGDWSTARMKDASRKSHIVGDVVNEYVSRALGKRFICFATDVETAGKMAERFNAVGIRVAAVSAKTPTDVRNEYIRRFRNGDLVGLVNVDLFGEGFDVPAVEVVIMARPTASLAVYLQQFGRALRILEGKVFGLVIDHVSNWKRHGFPDKGHVWSLDRRDKRAKSEPDPDDIPLTACTNCSRPYERFHLACPHCGHEPPLPDAGARTLEQVDGDLVLLDRATLAELRAAATLESPIDMGQRVSVAAGALAGAGAVNRQIERHASQQRLTAAINQWAGIERAKGRQDRETHRRFYLTLGVDVLSALGQSRQDMDKLASAVERWCGL